MDHRIEADGFDPEFHHVSFSAGTGSAFIRHNYWVLRIIRSLPESWVMLLGPEMASFVSLKRVSHYYLYKVP